MHQSIARQTNIFNTSCQVISSSLNIFDTYSDHFHVFLACQHRPFQCIPVSCRGLTTCITNFNHLTTVADIIRIALDHLSESPYSIANDCSLYIENPPYLFALQSTDFIQDILYRYLSSTIHFKLIFKRHSSPSRFAQRKQLLRTPPSPTVINPYEQLRIQELLIQKQQEIIHRLAKVNNDHQHIPTVNTRRSRQDKFDQSPVRETTRSHSQVRFRLSTVTPKHDLPSTPSSSFEVKSILKKSLTPRSSSVDRNIDQLVSLKHEPNSFCPLDDDRLSNASATDSCLGSLSSNDSVYPSIVQQNLETLV